MQIQEPGRDGLPNRCSIVLYALDAGLRSRCAWIVPIVAWLGRVSSRADEGQITLSRTARFAASGAGNRYGLCVVHTRCVCFNKKTWTIPASFRRALGITPSVGTVDRQ